MTRLPNTSTRGRQHDLSTGHPTKYSPGSALLNFSDLTGTGYHLAMFYHTWPSAPFLSLLRMGYIIFIRQQGIKQKQAKYLRLIDDSSIVFCLLLSNHVVNNRQR